MNVDRARALAEQYGKRLVDSSRPYELDLYDSQGRFEDSLHQKQILELDEDDFLEFYLDVPLDFPDYD